MMTAAWERFHTPISPGAPRANTIVTQFACLRAVTGEIIAENRETSGGTRKPGAALEESMESGEEEKAIHIHLSFCSLVLTSVLHSRPTYHHGSAKMLCM